MNTVTAIIGAGISGLLLARTLKASGASVVVLEKSRGYGGRMATKRIGEAVFDQGAQYFTARSSGFIEETARWREAGLVVDWPDTAHRRMIGKAGMTTVPKGLAAGLKILREHRVTSARRHACGCWELEIDGRGLLRAELLLLTCPVPQSLALLAAGDVGLPTDVRLSLAALTYHPCLALLVVLAGASRVPAEGISFTDGPVRWMGDNVKKGLAQNVPAAVTIHASSAFSAEHYGKNEEAVAELLLPAVGEWLGAPVVSRALHRWKFSEPKVTHAESCVWLPELGLGFAGDAFGGPKIEGAAMSGLALADRLRGHLVTG